MHKIVKIGLCLWTVYSLPVGAKTPLKYASDLYQYGTPKTYTLMDKTHAYGQIQEGGMLTIKTTPNAKIQYAGLTVTADASGRAVLGFHRDEEKSVSLMINGQKITLTPIDGIYNIQHINRVASKYVSPPADVLKRIRQDIADAKNARKKITPVQFYDKVWQNPVQWKNKIRITGVYGSQRVFKGVPKTPHYGVDYAVPVGTPLLAPMDGTIVLVKDMYYSGKTIIMNHGGGVFSSFLHLSKMTVAVGDKVTTGTVIGATGNTGRSTGPHLDWRMNWMNKRINPELLVGHKF